MHFTKEGSINTSIVLWINKNIFKNIILYDPLISHMNVARSSVKISSLIQNLYGISEKIDFSKMETLNLCNAFRPDSINSRDSKRQLKFFYWNCKASKESNSILHKRNDFILIFYSAFMYRLDKKNSFLRHFYYSYSLKRNKKSPAKWLLNRVFKFQG